MAVRRGVVQRIGTYDTRLIRGQDLDYYYRCVNHGCKVVYEPTALAYHRLTPERMTLNYFRWVYHVCGYYRAYFQPTWRTSHLLTLLPVSWYRQTLRLTAAWVKGLLARRPWVEQFYDELRLRQHVSLWLHRLQLWPWWWLTVLTAGSSKVNDASV